MSATRSAPKATSATVENPSFRTMPTSASVSMPENSAGKLGARIAATCLPLERRARTSSRELLTCFAPMLQTLKQLPQATQRSGRTSALPEWMRMALAGHSRTQV